MTKTVYFNFNNEQELFPISLDEETGKVTIKIDDDVTEFNDVEDFAENYAMARNVLPENLKNWQLLTDGDQYSYVLRAGTAGISEEDAQKIINFIKQGEELGIPAKDLVERAMTKNTLNSGDIETGNQEDVTSEDYDDMDFVVDTFAGHHSDIEFRMTAFELLVDKYDASASEDDLKKAVATKMAEEGWNSCNYYEDDLIDDFDRLKDAFADDDDDVSTDNDIDFFDPDFTSPQLAAYCELEQVLLDAQNTFTIDNAFISPELAFDLLEDASVRGDFEDEHQEILRNNLSKRLKVVKLSGRRGLVIPVITLTADDDGCTINIYSVDSSLTTDATGRLYEFNNRFYIVNYLDDDATPVFEKFFHPDDSYDED